MATWSPKNFKILEEIRTKFEDLTPRKGEQMRAASGALLWYILASPKERVKHENYVRELEAGVVTFEGLLAMTAPKGELTEDQRLHAFMTQIDDVHFQAGRLASRMVELCDQHSIPVPVDVREAADTARIAAAGEVETDAKAKRTKQRRRKA